MTSEQSPKEIKQRHLGPRLLAETRGKAVVSILLVTLTVLFAAWTTSRTAKSFYEPGSGDRSVMGHFDFFYATYYPVKDALSGNNPYEPNYKERNPDGEQFPAFSPTHLLLHSWTGISGYRTAAWIYFSLNLCLLVAAAYLTSRIVFKKDFFLNGYLLVLTLVFVSRMGYLTPYYGQVTILIVLGAYLALAAGEKHPWLAGVGLTIVSIKAQYIVPLGILLLFAGRFRSLAAGATLSIAGSLVAVAFIASHVGGPGAFWDGVVQTYFSSDKHPAVPHAGDMWTRIDIADQFVKLTGIKMSFGAEFAVAGAVWISAGLFVLWTRKRIPNSLAPDSPLILILLSAVILSVYHVHYDFLFLLLPLVAALFSTHPLWESMGRVTRTIVALTLLIPFGNYFYSRIGDNFPVESWIWKIGVCGNSIAIMFGCALVIRHLIASAGSPTTSPHADSSLPSS